MDQEDMLIVNRKMNNALIDTMPNSHPWFQREVNRTMARWWRDWNRRDR